MNNENLEEQLIDLQSRVAYQEDTLQQLNAVIADQDAYIRALQVQMQALAKKLDDLSYSVEQRDSRPVDEKPPHY